MIEDRPHGAALGAKGPPDVPDVDALEPLAQAAEPTVTSSWWISVQATEHLLGAIALRDRHTGECLPQSLHELLLALDGELAGARRPLPVDRLAQSVELCAQPLKAALERHRTRIVREHQYLPFHRLREVDAASVAWLARQPGRTVREKLAGRHSALGVVRRATADTPENRLVVALATRLGRRLGERVAAVQASAQRSEQTPAQGPAQAFNGYDNRQVDVQRREQLESALHLCHDRLRHSELAEIPAATRPQPNNALLSDPVYSRLWRVWRWLQAYPDELAALWPRLPARLQSAVFWLLAARLVGAGVAIPFDGIVRVSPGYDGQPSGVTCLGSQADGPSRWLPPDRTALALLLAPSRPDEPWLRLVLRLISGRLRIESGPVAGPGNVRAGTAQTVFYELQVADGPLRSQRGMPLTLRRLNAQGEPAASWQEFGDIAGLAALSEALAADVLKRALRSDRAPRPLRARSLPQPPAGCTAHRLGIDPTWPVLVLADGSRRFVPATCGWGLLFHFDGRTEWLDGNRPRNTPLHGTEPSIYSILDVLAPDLRDDGLSLQNEALRITSGLAQELALAAEARVAYAVPDCIDELSQKSLRAAMSAAFPQSLPIWRSVAAAMGWQRSGEHGDAPFAAIDIRDGDPLLVFDVESPLLTTTVLIARFDRRLGELRPETRGLYWERRPSPPRGEQDEALAWRVLLARYATELVGAALHRRGIRQSAEESARLATNLVRTGRLHALLDSNRSMLVPLDPEGQKLLELQPDARIWRQLQDDWVRQLQEPARELSVLISSIAPNRRAHCLLLGSIFRRHRPARVPFEQRLARWTNIVTLHPDAVAHGAQHCLLRLDQGCRTWAEWLPDLHLEVVRDGLFDELPLLKEQRIDDPLLGVTTTTRVPEGLWLPEGLGFLKLPLVTGRAGRRPVAVEARLQAPCFPLSAPIETTLRVGYRYGLDFGYELSVAPRLPDAAPFTTLMAEWPQPSPELAPGPYADSVPAFAPLPWHAAAGEAIENLCSLPQRMASYPLNPKMRGWMWFLLRDLWADGRDLLTASPRVVAAAEAVIPHLAAWAEQTVDPELSRDALEALCQLHQDAPDDAVSWLLTRLDSADDLESFKVALRPVAALLGDGQGERGKLLDHLLTDLRAYQHSASQANQMTGVLAAALWRHPKLVDAVAERGAEEIHFLIDSARRTFANLLARLPSVLDELGKGLTPENLQGWLGVPFRNSCELVLSLLRLRSTTALPWLRGGAPLPQLLARHIRLLDGMFIRAGISLKWRVPNHVLLGSPPASVGRVSAVAWTLNVLLTGESALHLLEVRPAVPKRTTGATA